MEPTKKKKIIIVIVILAIIGIILGVWSLTKSRNEARNKTQDPNTVDLGQLDPTKQGLNPDGTPIINTGTNGGVDGGTNTGTGTGTDTKYSNIYNTPGNTGTNGSGYNNGGSGYNGGNGGGYNGGGGTDGGGGGGGGTDPDNLVDVTDRNNRNTEPGGGTEQQDVCAKAYADMTTRERNLCLGGPGLATEIEDNNLVLTDEQRQRLDDLDRAFYRTAPALANPDILGDYIDEKQDYEEQHSALTKLIVQCINIINNDSFQTNAGIRAVDGRTWYRGNPKNGYTPGTARVSGTPFYRPRILPVGYYYNRYYGEDPTCQTCGSINGYGRQGGTTFETYLENIFHGKNNDKKIKSGVDSANLPTMFYSWYDRGTFLRTTLQKPTPGGNSTDKADPDLVKLRQFEELFEIY